MTAQDTTGLSVGLRLLAHPWIGAVGISDDERQLLADAAHELDRLSLEVERLRQELGSARAERDLWQKESTR